MEFNQINILIKSKTKQSSKIKSKTDLRKYCWDGNIKINLSNWNEFGKLPNVVKVKKKTIDFTQEISKESDGERNQRKIRETRSFNVSFSLKRLPN